MAQGVADYSREHESWDFTTSPPTMAEAEEVALTPYSLKLDVRIPPGGVIARRSTDTITVEDPHVRAAVHFMRDHLHEAFGLERVLEHLDVSRRLLHERFQRLLGRPPYEYLCNLRVERAKQLLSIPNRVKMRKIAAECGFSSAARMRLVFQRVAGVTPLEYYRLHGIVAASKSPKSAGEEDR